MAVLLVSPNSALCLVTSFLVGTYTLVLPL